MSDNQEVIVDDLQIRRLHDALTWRTTPPPGEFPPHLISIDEIPIAQVPEAVGAVFPRSAYTPTHYRLLATGMVNHCLHHIERRQSCLNVRLEQYYAHAGVIAMSYDLTPFKGPRGRICHTLGRVCSADPAVRHKLNLPVEYDGRTESLRSPGHPYEPPQILSRSSRPKKIPGADETDGLIDLLLGSPATEPPAADA